jgi:hypothetical protein
MSEHFLCKYPLLPLCPFTARYGSFEGEGLAPPKQQAPRQYKDIGDGDRPSNSGVDLSYASSGHFKVSGSFGGPGAYPGRSLMLGDILSV